MPHKIDIRALMEAGFVPDEPDENGASEPDEADEETGDEE
jgi:hypothetical protein